ncbi:hypothetical protein [Emticicia agri]|uniref:Uncharacterized protein n=1 Tax=Emticicia agri TaxID=2492393 RepID=A0A4Q5M1Y5_9BACT|nr:hypothetical protein [Emticicia agri]RYU96242.1 hypothetical protein EWM59_08515 [Emticicia agri]
MEKSHTSTEKQSLMTQAMEIIESMSNQRIFLIGKPMTNLFNHLICGYTDENYSELLKKKINNEKND